MSAFECCVHQKAPSCKAACCEFTEVSSVLHTLTTSTLGLATDLTLHPTLRKGGAL